MTNATTGPVPGNPYAVIVLKGGFDVERFNYPAPVDALIAAVRYLREGRQVRLTDRTCSALKEAPELATLDAVLSLAGQDPAALGAGLAGMSVRAAADRVPVGPTVVGDGVPFSG